MGNGRKEGGIGEKNREREKFLSSFSAIQKRLSSKERGMNVSCFFPDIFSILPIKETLALRRREKKCTVGRVECFECLIQDIMGQTLV